MNCEEEKLIQPLTENLRIADRREDGADPITKLAPEPNIESQVQMSKFHRKLEAGERIVGKKMSLTTRNLMLFE